MNISKTEYDITVVNDNRINFMPENIIQEVLQNVLTICTTVKGSVPLDRDLGVSAVMIDEPVNVVRARISSEIIEAVRKYEPRARISEVNFSGDMNGKIIPHVKVRIVI